MKYTQSSYEDRVLQVDANKKIISQYQGLRKPIEYECLVCGNRHVAARANYLFEAHRCKNCVANERGMSLRKPHDQFIEEVQRIHPNIVVLEIYQNNNTPIMCRCTTCQHTWNAIPHRLLGGHGCPQCAHNRQGWLTDDTFKQIIANRFPGVVVHSTYDGTGQKVVCECTICGYWWKPYASTLLDQHSKGCPNCAHLVSPDEATMKQRVENANHMVEYVGGYTTMTHKARFRCKICGQEWEATPSNISKGRACPYCDMSRGESRICSYLIEHKIVFKTEYSFGDDVVKTLRFDFYLPFQQICIEYDGEQHYSPVAFDGDNETAYAKFQQCQINDAIKNQYCNDKNITLIRIPYTKYDEIFTILSKYLP